MRTSIKFYSSVAKDRPASNNMRLIVHPGTISGKLRLNRLYPGSDYERFSVDFLFRASDGTSLRHFSILHVYYLIPDNGQLVFPYREQSNPTFHLESAIDSREDLKLPNEKGEILHMYLKFAIGKFDVAAHEDHAFVSARIGHGSVESPMSYSIPWTKLLWAYATEKMDGEWQVEGKEYTDIQVLPQTLDCPTSSVDYVRRA